MNTICSCFGCADARHLPTKQVLNSKEPAKGYKRIIREIIRRSGYFRNKNYEQVVIGPTLFALIVWLVLFQKNKATLTLNAMMKVIPSQVLDIPTNIYVLGNCTYIFAM